MTSRMNGSGRAALRAGALGLLTSGVMLAAPTLASATQMADPPGNNGVVKIQEVDADTPQPDNDPHVGCTFDVELYNYDAGDYYADVVFETQAPTTGGVTVKGTTHVFIGGDPASGGTDLDGRETYTLSFTGTPHAQQGYHVKVTVTAPGSIGNDTKTKVFWVTGCTSTPPPTTSTTTTPATTTTTTTTTTTGTTTGTTTPGETGTVPALVQTDGVGGPPGSAGLLAAIAGAFLVLGSAAWRLFGRRAVTRREH